MQSGVADTEAAGGSLTLSWLGLKLLSLLYVFLAVCWLVCACSGLLNASFGFTGESILLWAPRVLEVHCLLLLSLVVPLLLYCLVIVVFVSLVLALVSFHRSFSPPPHRRSISCRVSYFPSCTSHYTSGASTDSSLLSRTTVGTSSQPAGRLLCLQV